MVAIAACDALTPEERRQKLHLPKVGYQANPVQGKSAFEQYCVKCHGHAASGSVEGPPLVHETYRPTRHANMAFHFAVKDGVSSHHWSFGPMPAIDDVTPENVEDIIAYVRQLQRKAAIQ